MIYKYLLLFLYLSLLHPLFRKNAFEMQYCNIASQLVFGVLLICWILGSYEYQEGGRSNQKCHFDAQNAHFSAENCPFLALFDPQNPFLNRKMQCFSPKTEKHTSQISWKKPYFFLTDFAFFCKNPHFTPPILLFLPASLHFPLITPNFSPLKF